MCVPHSPAYAGAYQRSPAQGHTDAPSAPEPAIAAIEETTTGVQQAAAAAELSSNTEILHGQVQSLGSQVERLQDSKASAVEVMANGATMEAKDSSVIGSVDAYSTNTTNANNNEFMVAGCAAPIHIEGDVSELRQTNSEMREVVRYMRRERELLEVKLAVAESEGARLSATLTACQRSLQEARAEWRHELEKSRSLGHSEENFNRLMAELIQIFKTLKGRVS